MVEKDNNQTPNIHITISSWIVSWCSFNLDIIRK